MRFTSEKLETVPPEFIFVGEHPAIDFANNFVMLFLKDFSGCRPIRRRPSNASSIRAPFSYTRSIWKGSIAFGLTGELPTPILRVSIPSFSRVATLLGKFHVVVTVAVLVPCSNSSLGLLQAGALGLKVTNAFMCQPVVG